MKKLILVLSLILLIIFLEKSGYIASTAPIQTSPVFPTLVPKSELDSDKLWLLIQNWRMSQNLQTYIKDQNLCDIAKIRLQEIEIDFSHNGFLNMNLPFKEGAENLIVGYTSEEESLLMWLNSPSHLEDLKYPYTYSCVATNDYYAVQVFANF